MTPAIAIIVASAEWMQAALTGVPILIASAWILRILSGLWRESLWPDAEPELRAESERTGEPIRPIWCGWAVGKTLKVRGSYRGARWKRTASLP